MRYLANGPFNAELNTAYEDLQKTVLATMASKGPWGDLTIFRDSALESASALEAYSNTLQSYVAQGLIPVATAFVLSPEVEDAQFMADQYTSIYEQAGLQFKILKKIEPALAWLKSELDA